jgi:hypothetical protein
LLKTICWCSLKLSKNGMPASMPLQIPCYFPPSHTHEHSVFYPLQKKKLRITLCVPFVGPRKQPLQVPCVPGVNPTQNNCTYMTCSKSTVAPANTIVKQNTDIHLNISSHTPYEPSGPNSQISQISKTTRILKSFTATCT